MIISNYIYIYIYAYIYIYIYILKHNYNISKRIHNMRSKTPENSFRA